MPRRAPGSGPGAMSAPFPGGRRFAFTIMDDTDVATRANVGPIYRLLDELGMRTTKTVWAFDHADDDTPFRGSETLDDPGYVEFVRWLAARGFEIAFHGASMESSPRDRTLAALRRFAGVTGSFPRVYANHAYNRENLYWGVARLDDLVLRAIYGRTEGRPRGHYAGAQPGSEWWWGDQAARLAYVRNLTFDDIDTARWNPSMPYRDPRRPVVQGWFSAADAEDAVEFDRLLAPAAQDRLERDGGVCIVATHLGKGFCADGRVRPQTEALLRRLAERPGWFVPVGTLLDWMAERNGGVAPLPRAEWRRMQWRWAWDLLRRNIRRRLGVAR